VTCCPLLQQRKGDRFPKEQDEAAQRPQAYNLTSTVYHPLLGRPTKHGAVPSFTNLRMVDFGLQIECPRVTELSSIRNLNPQSAIAD